MSNRGVLDPDLLDGYRQNELATANAIKAEAEDPDLALLRWAGALGLALTALFGLSPFTEAERERLFQRLLDDRYWIGASKADDAPSPPDRERADGTIAQSRSDRGLNR